MIYQAYGNPQSSSSSLRGTPTAAWIKKFDKSKLVEFFGLPIGYSPAAKIPALCAWQASLPIFERGNRTYAHGLAMRYARGTE